MKIDFVDLVQGIDKEGFEFGYAGIEGRGGRFWTWLPTYQETIDSIEDDELNPPENWPDEAYRNVRGIIRRNYRRAMDRSGKNAHMIGRSMIDI